MCDKMAISARILKISEKLWLLNHKRADFLASKFWILFSLCSLLKVIFADVISAKVLEFQHLTSEQIDHI